MQIPALTIGGQLSICSYVRHRGPQFYASLYFMGNIRSGAFTGNPVYGDILWTKFVRSTLEMEVATMRGGAWRYLHLPNGWYVAPCLHSLVVLHSCFHRDLLFCIAFFLSTLVTLSYLVRAPSEDHWAHYCISHYTDGGRAIFVNGVEMARAAADDGASVG
jgi:hypothetical protein